MNPIIQGVDSGYSPEEIIQFISKAMPQMIPKISKAINKGYGIKEILGFLSKSTPQDTKGLSETEIHSRNRENDSKLVQNGLMAAGSALATPLAANAARSALSRALPQSLAPVAQSLANSNSVSGNASPSPQPSPMSPMQSPPTTNTTGTQSPSSSQQPPLSNANAASIPEPSNINQSKGFDTNIIKNVLGYRSQIDALINNGNGPEQIEAYLKTFNPQFIKTIEKEGKGAFKDVVAQYMQEQLRDEAMQPEGSIPNAKTAPIQEQPQLQEAEQLQEPIEQPEVKAEEELNEVLTPNGFGEVKISRNGESIVEVDGKKHKIEDAKMLKPPKEAAIEAMELIKSFTPEEMRSTHHMLNSYDEAEKKAFFVFHNGDAYVVDDISPEEYDELSKEVSEAKTSGETIIGKWAKGTGSRGAGYNKVVKGHRDRKVVPELKKNFRKLKVGYNLLSEWQRLLNEK